MIREPVVALNPVAGDHEYEMPPVADSVVALPLHKVVAPLLATMVGSALTVIVVVAVLLQPAALVPFTVYVVVVVPEKVTGEPVVGLRPAAGDHE